MNSRRTNTIENRHKLRAFIVFSNNRRLARNSNLITTINQVSRTTLAILRHRRVNRRSRTIRTRRAKNLNRHNNVILNITHRRSRVMVVNIRTQRGRTNQNIRHARHNINLILRLNRHLTGRHSTLNNKVSHDRRTLIVRYVNRLRNLRRQTNTRNGRQDNTNSTRRRTRRANLHHQALRLTKLINNHANINRHVKFAFTHIFLNRFPYLNRINMLHSIRGSFFRIFSHTNARQVRQHVYLNSHHDRPQHNLTLTSLDRSLPRLLTRVSTTQTITKTNTRKLTNNRTINNISNVRALRNLNITQVISRAKNPGRHNQTSRNITTNMRQTNTFTRTTNSTITRRLMFNRLFKILRMFRRIRLTFNNNNRRTIHLGVQNRLPSLIRREISINSRITLQQRTKRKHRFSSSRQAIYN